MYDRSIKLYDEPHSPDKLDQVLSKGNPNRGKFLTKAHFHSYYLQMLTISQLEVQSVLEIGPGENLTGQYIESLGIDYDTMDIISASEPTILSKLEDFDISSYQKRYDLVCAFQMLEHSPYEMFADNIRKMSALSDRYVFISLPYSCFGFRFECQLSFGQRRHLGRKFSFYLPLNRKNRRYREEYKKEFPWAVHYWEIGRRGYPLRQVKQTIESCNLKIVDSFHSNNPFHYYFLAEKL